MYLLSELDRYKLSDGVVKFLIYCFYLTCQVKRDT